jgi:Cu/Ag efflux protein CusF
LEGIADKGRPPSRASITKLCARLAVFLRRNQSGHPGLIAHVSNTGRLPMNIAKIMLAGTAALIISSAALAQQALNGTITGLNRINGTITIQQTQSGTVGANAGSAAQELKVQDGLSLDDLHAGNRVTFSVTERDGIKTITKLQKQ